MSMSLYLVLAYLCSAVTVNALIIMITLERLGDGYGVVLPCTALAGLLGLLLFLGLDRAQDRFYRGR